MRAKPPSFANKVRPETGRRKEISRQERRAGKDEAEGGICLHADVVWQNGLEGFYMESPTGEDKQAEQHGHYRHDLRDAVGRLR